MRIVSWNCNSALRRKWDALDRFDADLYIVQECEDPAQSKDAAYVCWAGHHLWVGESKHKGLAVFAKRHWTLTPVSQDLAGLKLLLPCMVSGAIPLLATWTKGEHSPTFGYIGQIWKYLQQHTTFLDHPQAMLIGDWNSNARWDIWDRWWNHSDVVRQLNSLGLQSLYHHLRGEPQGQESEPTFFHQRKRDKAYHIDHAMVGRRWLEAPSRLTIGQFEDWLNLSDHMPVCIDLTPAAPP